jgi:flagellar biogenesis protein FliO
MAVMEWAGDTSTMLRVLSIVLVAVWVLYLCSGEITK